MTPDVEIQKRKLRSLFLTRLAFLLISAVLMLLLLGHSLTIGSANISIGDVYLALLDRILPGHLDVTERVRTIVWTLRMPRVLIAALAGATLGMAGCSTQAILKNPLATPYTLGVSAAAGFGASMWFVFGITLVGGTVGVIANAFIFSLIPAFVIIGASRRIGASPETMILSGVAISYMFSAANTLLQFFAEDDALRTSVFWLVGDLTRAAMWQVPYILVALMGVLIVGMYLSRDINIIKTGDEEAMGMGVNVGRVRYASLITACFATATVISFTGAIGFVGLLAPHISRLFIGGDERFLVPASALVGASLLLGADIVARSIIAPVLLPVGAITALIGGPLLLYLLLFGKSKRR